ncbi:MAG TPA: sialidase family protein [Verrucomicrobiae bacterium]|nr:sialidase family protein [Verrucomicrobiae bacterium]
MSLRALLVIAVAVLQGCGGDDAPPERPPFEPPAAPVPLSEVTDDSPLAANCEAGAAGTLYVASEVEPWVAANPLDANHLIGTWQQDRWSNGGARALLAAVSRDGGGSWARRQVPFSRCTGGNSVNGGDYSRATDPWVSFGADGTAYWMAMTIGGPDSSATAMRVARSLDGGDTWEAPITLIHDVAPYQNDKNAVTADPTDASYAYAVWDRLNSVDNNGPAWLARTTDGGATWEAARKIYDPGFGVQTIGNQVAVLPDGTLLNLFTEIRFDGPGPDGSALKVLRSLDHGVTWGTPVTIAEVLAVGVSDPENGTAVRSGSMLGAIGVAPDGSAWVAWQDARFSGGARDAIALSRSDDGGLTWSAPIRVNAAPETAAFTPAVQVAADGTVGVLYYDLRDNTADSATLLASLWLATSTDGVAWQERLVAGPADLGFAPFALGLFYGDYVGLAAANGFVPFFAQQFPSTANRTNIYAVALPAQPPATLTATKASYQVGAAPKLAMTVEWAMRIEQNIERDRHHFPDDLRPGQLPRYLR